MELSFKNLAEIAVFAGIWRNYVAWLDGRRDGVAGLNGYIRRRKVWLGEYLHEMNQINLYERRLKEEGYISGRRK